MKQCCSWVDVPGATGKPTAETPPQPTEEPTVDDICKIASYMANTLSEVASVGFNAANPLNFWGPTGWMNQMRENYPDLSLGKTNGFFAWTTANTAKAFDASVWPQQVPETYAQFLVCRFYRILSASGVVNGELLDGSTLEQLKTVAAFTAGEGAISVYIEWIFAMIGLDGFQWMQTAAASLTTANCDCPGSEIPEEVTIPETATWAHYMDFRVDDYDFALLPGYVGPEEYVSGEGFKAWPFGQFCQVPTIRRPEEPMTEGQSRQVLYVRMGVHWPDYTNGWPEDPHWSALFFEGSNHDHGAPSMSNSAYLYRDPIETPAGWLFERNFPANAEMGFGGAQVSEGGYSSATPCVFYSLTIAGTGSDPYPGAPAPHGWTPPE